jgi:hypothetical protein
MKPEQALHNSGDRNLKSFSFLVAIQDFSDFVPLGFCTFQPIPQALFFFGGSVFDLFFQIVDFPNQAVEIFSNEMNRHVNFFLLLWF